MYYDWQTVPRSNEAATAALLPPAMVEEIASDTLQTLHSDHRPEPPRASLAAPVTGSPLRTAENFHRHHTHAVAAVKRSGDSNSVEGKDRPVPPVSESRFPFQVEANTGNHLAWMNAILGLQRTLMAAQRTAVALIAFGFTVAQVFKNMQQVIPRQVLVLGPHLPRLVGLLMIATGIGSLALFTWQYLRAVSYLEAEPFTGISMRIKVPLHQLTCLSAYAIMLLGALGFGSVFLSY